MLTLIRTRVLTYQQRYLAQDQLTILPSYHPTVLPPYLCTGSGTSLKTNQTYVDGKAETVLIPVYGQLVPFHISTIKCASLHTHTHTHTLFTLTLTRYSHLAPSTSRRSSHETAGRCSLCCELPCRLCRSPHSH